MQLPPCVVCGRPALDGSGWTSTLNEPEAAKLLGHAPPRERAVVDPKGRKRRWVGHETCTGRSLRTPERSAELLGERLARSSDLKRQLEARGLAAVDPNRKTGLTCESCSNAIAELAQRPLLPEYRDDWRLQNTMAWQCIRCGLWLCHRCGHGTPSDGYGGGHRHALAHFGCSGAFYRLGFAPEPGERPVRRRR